MSQKILIVAPSWLGDMMMANALFRALKTNDPNCSIDVLAPAWCLDVIKRMPEIRRGVVMPVSHGQLQLRQRYRLAKQLAQEKYTQAIVLPNSLKSALIPWFASIPKRTGFVGEMRYGLLNDWRHLDKTGLPLMVQRFVHLAKAANERWDINDFPYPRLQCSAEDVTNTLFELAMPKPDKPVIVLAPGAAYGDSKRWPWQHYATLAQSLLQQGHAVWLFGSPKEYELLQQINVASEEQCQVLDKASLTQKIDLMSLAKCVVSNDSGLMHVAAALGIPTLGIFGSTSPAFTPPLGEATLVIEQSGLDCRPCFKRSCQFEDERKLQCLHAITPQHVATKMTELLASCAR